MPGPVPRAVSREREARAWKLVQDGRTQDQIAAELGVTQPAVSQILARVERRVLAELQADVIRRKARQQVILDRIVSESMAAWDASKEPRKKSSRKTKLSAGTDPKSPMGATKVEEMNAAENSHGDPRYLAEARAALADERKLWGLDAPIKVAPTEPDGSKLERLTDDQLETRIGELLAEIGVTPALPGASTAPVIDVTPEGACSGD